MKSRPLDALHELNQYQSNQYFDRFEEERSTQKDINDFILAPNQFAYIVSCKDAVISQVKGNVKALVKQANDLTIERVQSMIKPSLVEKYIKETSANFDFIFAQAERAIPLRNTFSSLFSLKGRDGNYSPYNRSSFTLRSDRQGIVTHTACIFTKLPPVKVSTLPFDQYQVFGQDALFSQVEALSAFKFLFSERELIILRLIALGERTKTIADRLFLSPKTVETHRKNMLKKLEAKSTPHMVALAKDMGLI